MRAISNSSPMIALAVARELEIFKHLFGNILIPPKVYREVVEECKDAEEKRYLLHVVEDFITVAHPEKYHDFERRLDAGEIEVLSLALEQRPDFLIIDDRKARNEAIDIGLEDALFYTTDIIKEAENRNFIHSYDLLMTTLKASGIYLPESVADFPKL